MVQADRQLLGPLLGSRGRRQFAGQLASEFIALLLEAGQFPFEPSVALHGSRPSCLQLLGQRLGRLQALTPFGLHPFSGRVSLLQLRRGGFEFHCVSAQAGLQIVGQPFGLLGCLLFGLEFCVQFVPLLAEARQQFLEVNVTLQGCRPGLFEFAFLRFRGLELFDPAGLRSFALGALLVQLGFEPGHLSRVLRLAALPLLGLPPGPRRRQLFGRQLAIEFLAVLLEAHQLLCQALVAVLGFGQSLLDLLFSGFGVTLFFAPFGLRTLLFCALLFQLGFEPGRLRRVVRLAALPLLGLPPGFRRCQFFGRQLALEFVAVLLEAGQLFCQALVALHGFGQSLLEFLFPGFGVIQFFAPFGLRMFSFCALLLQFRLGASKFGSVAAQATLHLFGPLPGVRRRLLLGGQFAIQFVALLPEAGQFLFETLVAFDCSRPGPFHLLFHDPGSVELLAPLGLRTFPVGTLLLQLCLGAFELGGIAAQAALQLLGPVRRVRSRLLFGGQLGV